LIEKNYSRYIFGDPTDALTRATLLDFRPPANSADIAPLARLAS
jgi:hypothetical protein